jgi:hypothetical protein
VFKFKTIRPISQDIRTLLEYIDNLKYEMEQQLNATYAVGDLYFSTNSENPSKRFGGTWALWGAGRVPVCVDEAQEEFNTVEKEGGDKNPQRHSHSFKEGSHTFTWGVDGLTSPVRINNAIAEAGDPPGNELVTSQNWWTETNETGTGESGNLQPYITCYIWKRTA